LGIWRAACTTLIHHWVDIASLFLFAKHQHMEGRMEARDTGRVEGPAQICFWTWLGSYWTQGWRWLQGTALGRPVGVQRSLFGTLRSRHDGRNALYDTDCTGRWRMRRFFFLRGESGQSGDSFSVCCHKMAGQLFGSLATIEWKCSTPLKNQ